MADMTKRENLARAAAKSADFDWPHTELWMNRWLAVVDAILAELREPDDRMRAASTRLNHPTDDEIWYARIDAIRNET